MPMTRRAALALPVLGLAGCTSSPVIVGDPETAAVEPPPPEPTRSPAADAAHAAVAILWALLDAMVDSPHWEPQAWNAAALAQCEAHLARLEVEDPLSPAEQEPVFEVDIPAAAPPSDPNVAINRLNDTVATAVDALEAAAGEAATAELRLWYTSMSTAALGLHDQSVAPIEGDAQPRPLQPTTVGASLPVLLGHVWALAYGLGVGLGRLAGDDPLQALGTARLSQVNELRNELRATLGEDAPQQPAAFDLPTAMDTPESIREGWGHLEVQVLNGYARLVAADADPGWRSAMRAQVAPVQATRTALTWWPGWLA